MMTRWRVAEAKQKLSEVIRAAAKDPQLILSRDRPAAVVVSPETFQEFLEWKSSRGGSIGEAFEKLRAICNEEDYQVMTQHRRNRPNAFVGAVDDAG